MFHGVRLDGHLEAGDALAGQYNVVSAVVQAEVVGVEARQQHWAGQRVLRGRDEKNCVLKGRESVRWDRIGPECSGVGGIDFQVARSRGGVAESEATLCVRDGLVTRAGNFQFDPRAADRLHSVVLNDANEAGRLAGKAGDGVEGKNGWQAAVPREGRLDALVTAKRAV